MVWSKSGIFPSTACMTRRKKSSVTRHVSSTSLEIFDILGVPLSVGTMHVMFSISSCTALKSQFLCHVDMINSLEICVRNERTLILSASSDCSVQLWDIYGNHIGVFGQVKSQCMLWRFSSLSWLSLCHWEILVEFPWGMSVNRGSVSVFN